MGWIGYGRYEYGELTYGHGSASVSFTPTGVESTFAVGTPVVTGKANLTLTGQEATYSLGTFTFSGKANFTLTGVQSTFSLGTPVASAAAELTLIMVLCFSEEKQKLYLQGKELPTV